MPHPKGVWWWNKACSIAQMATQHAQGATHCTTFKTLCQTMREACHQWAYDLLHEAADSADIWCMAVTHKGWQANSFPTLHTADNTLVKNPNLKAEALKAQFFPTVRMAININ